MHDTAEMRGAFIGEKSMRGLALRTVYSPPTLMIGRTGRQVSSGGEDFHDCESECLYPWVKVSKERGPASVRHPCCATREEQDLVAMCAMIHADALR